MTGHKPMHGTSRAVGCSHLRLSNFCRMLPDQPSWAEDCGIERQCDAEAVARALGGIGGLMHDARDESKDSGLPAAYTFFSQFIDHDITLDTETALHGEALPGEEIDDLPNLRSPSLDLDNVYGFGPEASPFLYDESQPGRLLTGSQGNPDDVPRNKDGRALIGDPRNDENLFVSQMQLLFLRFHNRLLIGRSFEQAQDQARYHYQKIVLDDFLARVCDEKVFEFARDKMQKAAEGKGGYPLCDLTDACGRLCMPVEFSVGAYRFGHTMVRSTYPANADYPVIELFDERFGTLGFGPVPAKLTVDWRYLLDVENCHPYVKSKAIDHLLADELIRLPDPVVGRNAGENDRSLAFRNLLRGYVLSLPSGQRVAQALADKGYPVHDCQDLTFEEIPGWGCAVEGLPCDVAEHTPLFFYLMREAGAIGRGERLGPVASAILMEVFGAMLLHCHSFLTATDEDDNPWAPDPCIAGHGELTLADIVRYVRA